MAKTRSRISQRDRAPAALPAVSEAGAILSADGEEISLRPFAKALIDLALQIINEKGWEQESSQEEAA